MRTPLTRVRCAQILTTQNTVAKILMDHAQLERNAQAARKLIAKTPSRRVSLSGKMPFSNSLITNPIRVTWFFVSLFML